MKKRQRIHIHAVSKWQPQKANGATCDNHDKEIERKKCHKGKIDPP